MWISSQTYSHYLKFFNWEFWPIIYSELFGLYFYVHDTEMLVIQVSGFLCSISISSCATVFAADADIAFLLIYTNFSSNLVCFSGLSFYICYYKLFPVFSMKKSSMLSKPIIVIFFWAASVDLFVVLTSWSVLFPKLFTT